MYASIFSDKSQHRKCITYIKYTEYKTILIQPTHMQAKLPMANLQVQVSSGHGGVTEVSRSHGQSSWVIPTEKKQNQN